MKKTIALLLSVSMLALLLCACGNTEKEDELSYEDMTKIDWTQYITLGDYSSITLDMYPDVTDDDIESAINELLLEKKETVEITDRETKSGDTVNIDFVGKVDGEEFSGGSAKGYNLELGSGAFIDGFEDGLIGKKTGDTVSLNLTFPDPYKNNPDLAGKPVVFDVTINKITETVYPEFNDTFVAENTDYKTVKEYRDGTSRELEEAYHNQMVMYKSSYAYYDVYDKSEFTGEYPDGLCEKLYNEYMDYYTQAAKDYNLELSEYLATYQGATEDDLKNAATSWSEKMAKQTVLLFAVAQKENLFIIDDETYQKEVAAYATEQGYSTVEELKEAEVESNIKMDITMKRVLNFLVEKVTETGTYADGTVASAADNGNGEE